jgi:hypothetical protein
MQLTNRIVCGFALSASLLLAQADPSGRVARLSYMYHGVSFLPAGADDWAAADYNRPLTTGDRVFADPTATAELQIGIAALRLGSGTALEFLNLDDSNAQLSLTQGMLLVRLRTLGGQDSFEVDTPNLAFSLTRPGEYRIDVYPDSTTTVVTVRSGEGELTGPDQAFTVHAGEQARAAGADQPSYQIAGVPERGQLENWALDRDQRWDQSPSARYVSREMVGFEDLDQYGSWRNTPDYGNVWVPNGVAADWAPYHTGHWLWVDPWGWTWVDDAPWGFAPFHYGRWAFIGGSWGWVPGPVAERPVYAPALVAWVGGGAVGGGVAWFPLGPREVFVPAYRTSPQYVTRVNVTNTVIVNNVVNVNVTNVTYVNRNAPRAVMAVQQAAFASARPVQEAAIVVRPEAIRSASIVANAAVAPSRASVVRVAAPGTRVAQPTATVQARPVIAKRTPPPPPVPFAQKQQALAANGGRPLEPSQVQQIRQSQPAAARPATVKQVQARPPASTLPPTAQRPVAVPQAKPSAPPPPAAPVQRPAPPPTQAAPPVQRPTPAPEARPAAPPVPEARPAAPPVPEARPAAPPAPAPRPTPAPEARPAAPPAPAQRQAPAPEARPAEPRPPAASPAPAREAQRPAPGQNNPPPKSTRPAPKKKDEKEEDKDKK